VVTYAALKKQVGLAIRDLRLRRGISQEDLAKRAKLARSYLCAVERGDRNLTLLTMFRLADALEVPVDALFHAGANTRPGPGDQASSKPEPQGFRTLST
jgi:transcriptional regulator with XRE-family HTH domain